MTTPVHEELADRWAGCCRSDSLTPEHDDYAGVGRDEMCRDCPHAAQADQ